MELSRYNFEFAVVELTNLTANGELRLHWQSPPKLLHPSTRSILHLWRLPLGAKPEQIKELQSLLDGRESARLERFRFKVDRHRYAVHQGGLRLLLAQYIRMAPQELVFKFGPFGKPALQSETLRFNLSHSDALACYAVTEAGEVGIDIEQIKTMRGAELLVSRYFDDEERKTWRRLAPIEQIPYFLKIWTQREAWLKARGVGLTGFTAKQPPPGRLSAALQNFVPAHGYCGSVVVLSEPTHTLDTARPAANVTGFKPPSK